MSRLTANLFMYKLKEFSYLILGTVTEVVLSNHPELDRHVIQRHIDGHSVKSISDFMLSQKKVTAIIEEFQGHALKLVQDIPSIKETIREMKTNIALTDRCDKLAKKLFDKPMPSGISNELKIALAYDYKAKVDVVKTNIETVYTLVIDGKVIYKYHSRGHESVRNTELQMYNLLMGDLK